MVRLLVALSLGGAAAAALAIGCGGDPFLLELDADDATAGDAADEPAEIDVRAKDASDDPSDGSMPDGSRSETSAPDASAPDARDAAVGDGRSSFDGAGSDAVAEASPPRCGGRFACAPSVPSGWTGPFELYAGSGTSPACSTNFAGSLDANAMLTAQPAGCACSCDPPLGVQCSSPTLTFYPSSATCPVTSCASVTLAQGTCTTVDFTTPCSLGVAGAFASVPASAPSAGACNAVGVASVPNYAWATNVRACGASAVPTQLDCPAGSVCVPTPTPPFQASVCIEQAGDVACPMTGYTGKSLYYGGVDDTRACSTCTCGPVLGASCAGSLTQFMSDDGGCTTAQTIYNLPLSCGPVQQPADLQITLVASGGSCKSSVSAPTGSATPAKPMTFCCAP